MSTIPEYRQQTRARASYPTDSSAGRGLYALSKATESINQDMIVIKEQDAALWSTKVLSEAQLQWAGEFENRKQNASPGAENFTGQVLTDFDAYAAKLDESAPTGISRQYLRERLSAYRTTLAKQALTYEATERSAYAVDTVNKSIEAGRTLAYQNPGQFPELLAERSATINVMRLDPATKRALKDDAQYQMAHDAVAGMIDTNTEDAIGALRAPLGKSGVLAVESLGAEDRMQLTEAAEKKLLFEQEAAATERRKGLEKAASDLEISVYRGDGLRTAIEQSYANETITGAKRTQLHLEMDRQDAERTESEAIGNLVRLSRGLGIPLDPGDATHRKAVKAAYEGLEGDPFTPEHNAATSTLIKETGIVPDQVRSMVRAMSAAGSLEQAVAVADLVDQVQTVSPSAVDQFSQDEKAFSLQVQELIRAGTNPGQAVQLVRERIFKTSDAQRDIINAQYKSEAKGNSGELSDFIDDDFDTWNIRQPEAPSLMEAEFDRLTEAYFLKTHGIDSARRLAWNDLKSVWGLSQINGRNELMKYPPEMSGSGDRSDLPGEARIISDPRTARDGTYSVVVVADDDLPRIQPYRWSPNQPMPEDFTAAVDKARESRRVLGEIEYERDHAQELSMERLRQKREERMARIR